MSKKTFTLTESDLISCYEKRSEGDYTYKLYDGDGRVGASATSTVAYVRRVWCDFSAIWDSTIGTGNIKSAVLTVGLTGNADNTESFNIRAYAHDGGGIGATDEEVRFEACANGVKIGDDCTVAPGSSVTAEFYAGTGVFAYLASHRAVGLCPVDEPSAGSGVSTYADISSVKLTVEFADDNAKPDVAITSLTSPSRDGLLSSYTDDLTLTWSYSHESSMAQAEYQVQMRSEQSEWETVADALTSSTSCIITPDKFPEPYGTGSAMYVRVRCMSSRLVWSDWAEMATVLVFPKAYELDPGGGEVRLADSSFMLIWKAKVEYDGVLLTPYVVPSVFSIQYSMDGGETWVDLAMNHTAAKTGDIYYYTVPANTFPAGVAAWRVAPVVGGHTSEWERESFTVRVQASTSSVTCDGKPHPTVRWSSASQIAYQVRFADYDSGAIYGAATSHAIPYVYSDGVYPVQVRTQASDGTWSEWTEQEYVTITNTPQSGLLRLVAYKTQHAVNLKWQVITGWNTYILYRNDIPIYVGSAREYTDAAAVGECTYYVRGMAEPNYAQSDSVAIDARPAVDCMYDLTDRRWIPLKYSSAVRSRSYSETVNAVYRYYAGRRYPVAFVDGTRDRQLNVSYCFKTRADADTVYEALGHTVIYKDTQGRRIIGLFAGMAETVTKRFEHALTIVQTDYSEEVRYEP